jgi:hypothetical protein
LWTRWTSSARLLLQQVFRRSSNAEALEVSSSASPAADFKSASVEISRLPSAGEQGKLMNANALFGGSGYQQFEIQAGDGSQQFSVRLESGDTNKTVSRKWPPPSTPKTSA